MNAFKQKLHDILDTLPDDATYDDIRRAINAHRDELENIQAQMKRERANETDHG